MSAPHVCLFVLQPRQIEVALESIAELPCDKLYFQGMSEAEIAAPLNEFVRTHTRYSHFGVISDDCVVNLPAWQLILDLLEQYPAATGYCEIYQGSPQLNVTQYPLTQLNGMHAELHDYSFYNRFQLERTTDEVLWSWFGGWSLTFMPRAWWLEAPFRVNAWTGNQTDYETWYRLQRPLVFPRDGALLHLKGGSYDQPPRVRHDGGHIRFTRHRTRQWDVPTAALQGERP